MKTNTSKKIKFYTQGWRVAARVLLISGLLMSYSLGSALAVNPDPQKDTALDRATKPALQPGALVESVGRSFQSEGQGLFELVDSVGRSFQSEGLGLSPYDLHLMRERCVQPPLDSTDCLIQQTGGVDVNLQFFSNAARSVSNTEGPGLPTYDMHAIRERCVQPPLDSTDCLIQQTGDGNVNLQYLSDAARSVSNVVSNTIGPVVDSVSSSFRSEGLGLSPYDLHLMRERCVQPPLDKSGLPSSTDYLIQRIEREAIEMRAREKASFLEYLRSSQQSPEEQVDPDQAASTSSEAQADPDQAGPSGPPGGDGGGTGLPLPPFGGSGSDDTSEDDTSEDDTSEDDEKDARQLSAQEAAAKFKEIKEEVANLLKDCEKDSAFNALKANLADIAEQLAKDPNNAELQNFYQKQEAFLKSHPLYQKIIKLGIDAMALRERAEKKAEFCDLSANCAAAEGLKNRESREAAKQYQAEADEIYKDIIQPLREILNLPSTPRAGRRAAAFGQGAVESLRGTAQMILVDLPTLVVKGAVSLVKWEDKLGIKEGCANLKQWWKALSDQAQQPWETREEYQARMQAVEKVKKREKRYRRFADARNYHLSQAQKEGYMITELLQLCYGVELVKVAGNLPKLVVRGRKRMQAAAKALKEKKLLGTAAMETAEAEGAASRGGLSATTTITTKTNDILINPEAFKGTSVNTALMEIEKQVPADWIKSSINKGEGTKWVHPANNGESIMLEFGDIASKDLKGVHRGPYIRVTRHGKVTRVPLEGNPALNLNVE